MLLRYLDGRTHGPLFATSSGRPVSRTEVGKSIRTIGERAGLAYRVTPQLLDYALPTIALQRGFSFRSVINAAGVPDHRQAQRWAGPVSLSSEDNPSVRLARLILSDPRSHETYLMHVEALRYDSDLPDAFVVMTAGAILDSLH